MALPFPKSLFTYIRLVLIPGRLDPDCLVQKCKYEVMAIITTRNQRHTRYVLIEMRIS